MKPSIIQRISAYALVACFLATTAPETNAQNSAPAADSVKSELAQVKFNKLVFTRGRVTDGKRVLINDYFLPKQGPANWTHKLTMYVYPQLNDPQLYVKNMTANLAKQGIKATALPMENPKVAAVTFFEKNERMIKYNVFIYHTTKSGKILVGRHFTLRAKPGKEKPFRTLVAVQRTEWGNELLNAQFPGFKFPPKAPKTPQAAPGKAADTKLPVLKYRAETVDNSRVNGTVIKIDDDFALKQDSKKVIKAPFSVALPQTEYVMTLANPKVPETVRFTLSNKNKDYLESIRFTGLTIGTNIPMAERLQRACALLETQMVPKFLASYDDGKIVGHYKTKVGAYDASITIARMTHKDGRKFFVKFVGLLQEGKVDGLAIVLMINGSADERDVIKKRLDNGFAQQVLHSVRFEQ